MGKITHIILANKQTDISQININVNVNPNANTDIDLSKYYKFSGKPYMLFDCKELIPNFFQHIILTADLDHKIDVESIHNFYNMLLIGGVLTMDKKYGDILRVYNVKITLNVGNYINVERTSTKTFNKVKGTRAPFDCLIIGTQKASTTSALVNLLKHKDIGGPDDEIHFFDIQWYKGTGYLNNLMNKYNGKVIKIIKNPDLIYLNSTFPLIQSVNPFAKFILFLRNPIDRAYSSWQMIYNNGWTTKSFDEAIEEELEYRLDEPKTFYSAVYHYLGRGLYWKQINEFLRWFPVQNLKIFVIENYESHAEIYSEIWEFLNIDEPKEPIEFTKERIGKYNDKMRPETVDKLKKFFEQDIRLLEKFLGYKTGWIE